jgi:hypothetical protein
MLLTRLALWLSVAFILSFLFNSPAHPHGGGLDGYGCHHNRKAGSYHCHPGTARGTVVHFPRRDAAEIFRRQVRHT